MFFTDNCETVPSQQYYWIIHLYSLLDDWKFDCPSVTDWGTLREDEDKDTESVFCCADVEGFLIEEPEWIVNADVEDVLFEEPA